MTTVWIYVDTRYRVGDPGHLKVFADEEAANRWPLSSMRSWNELDRHRTILAMLLIVVLAILWNLLAL